MGWGPKAPDMSGANEAARKQAAIAQDQWDTQKSFFPKVMALADRDDARSQRLADQQEEDAGFYRGISQHQFDRSKLSEPYQDQMYGLVDSYANGDQERKAVGEASADVDREFSDSMGMNSRSMTRLGVNPNSGAYGSMMKQMGIARALGSAGAQNNARTQARNKAEQMVAYAAGAGQQGFSNGLNTGGYASNNSTSAANLGGMGMGGYSSANNSYNSGMSQAGAGFGSAGSGLRANAIESAKTPMFDFVAGLATAGVKGWAASDRRLKTDIRPVGKLDSGLTVYRYRYKAGGPVHLGVMADEVKLVLPKAVSRMTSGYDAVDYSLL